MNNAKCPVCDTKKNKKILQFQIYSVIECTKCNLQYIYPMPTQLELKKLYQREYFFCDLPGVKGYKNYQKLTHYLLEEARRKLKFIKNFTNSKKILDVGCGTGIFLKVAKENKFSVFGNDLSPFAIKRLKSEGIEVFEGSIENEIFPKEEFEIVTAWDVIEHTKDLKDSIKSIWKTLKKDGYLFITTPNTDSYDAKLMHRHWYGYKKIPEHAVFFNSKSIKKLLENHGFKVVKITGWGFSRNLDFIFDKLVAYSSFFLIIKKLLRILHISNLSMFFPLTDFMVVAKKV